jgi:hypothetical protein
VIAPNSPGLSTTPSETTGNVGDTLSDSATLSGATSGAGGTISFYLFAPGDNCSDLTTAVYSSTGVAVSGNNTYSSNGTASGSNVASQAGTYHWLATYSGDGNNNAASSACSDEAVVITNPVTGQITPTKTTCSQFNSGTSPTLSSLQYAVKGGKTSAVSPGVFFYWIKVTAVAGSNTFNISQAITSSNNNFNHFFAFASGSAVFNSSCTAVQPAATITTPSAGVTRVTFNASSAGTYIIGIKYDSKSVEGFTAPSPNTTVHYEFSTGGVTGSTQGLDLAKK